MPGLKQIYKAIPPVTDLDMGKEASPVVDHGCEEEDGECKQCQAKKCITGCAQTFRFGIVS